MTFLQLSASPLVVPPYLKMLRQVAVGDRGVEQFIYPKLAKAPQKIKPSDSLDKIALITDLRAADTPDAIGGSTEVPPADGIKLISPNDRFILLGGSAATQTKLYEQASHLYINTHLAADLPASPDFVKMAVFSLDMLRLFSVFNSDGTAIQVFNWSSSDPLDPNGIWNLGSPIDAGTTISSLELTPAGTFLVANLSTTFVCYDAATLAEITTPSGLYKTANADESEWIVAPSGVNAEVYSQAGGVLTLDYHLSTSTGTDRKFAYAPDEEVLMMTGKVASGTTMPRFWAKKNTRWHYITGQTNANAATWQTAKFLIKSDSTQVLHSFCDSDDTDPKVDALVRNTVTPDLLVDETSPFTGAGSPQGPGARPARNSAGTLIGTANQLMVYDPTTEGWTDVTPAGWSAATGLDISADGTKALIVKSGSQALWDIADGVVTADSMPSSGLPTTVYAGALSRDGMHMALNGVTASAGVIQLFERSGGVWSTMGGTIAVPRTDQTVLARTKVEWHPTRDDIIVIDGYGGTASGTVPRYFKLVSGTWTEQASPFPVPAGFTALYGDGAWSPNGKFFAMVSRGSVANAYKFLVFELEADDTFSLYVSLDFNPLATGSAVGIGQTEWSVDGKLIAVGVLDAARPMKLFQCAGDPAAPTITAYTALPASLTATAAGTGVIFSADTLTLWGNTAVSNHWLYSSFLTFPSYGLDYQFVMASTGLTPLDTYSFDQQFIHFGKAADAQHPYSTPLTPSPSYPTALGFAPAHAITDVYGVVISATGKTALYQVAGGGLFVASRPNAGSAYLTSEDLQGTFVDVYDLVGNTYTERNYSVYEYQTDVHDINFSPNEEVISYHVVNPPDAPPDQPQGRLIYDISGPGSSQTFEFKGAVFETDMTNSYIAFSPANTEFVVVHEHAVTHDPFISLHEFTIGYDYADQDTEPVEFGPADWSVCSDIVVAHGGTPPLTFFYHNDAANTLDPVAIDIGGWTNDGDPIIDVAWSPDCRNLIILLPDELVPITNDDDDPDPHGPKKPDTPTTLDPPLVYDPDDPDHKRPRIRWDDDDDVHIYDPGDGDGPGTHTRYHHYDPLTHDIPDISYVPYVVQTVTFRVYSVPEVP